MLSSFVDLSNIYLLLMQVASNRPLITIALARSNSTADDPFKGKPFNRIY